MRTRIFRRRRSASRWSHLAVTLPRGVEIVYVEEVPAAIVAGVTLCPAWRRVTLSDGRVIALY